MTRLLVFDSGVGGLSVAAEIRREQPGADITYVADDAGFPYGEWEDAALTDRVVGLIADLIGRLPARRGGHRLQHRLDAGAAAAPRPLRHPLRRHRAGDQAGGGADAQRRGQRARHLRHHPPRLYARADRELRARPAMCGWSAPATSRPMPSATCAASRWTTIRSLPRSRRPSSSTTAGGPTWSCSPARTTPSFFRISSGWRHGRWSGSTRRRRSRAASWRSPVRAAGGAGGGRAMLTSGGSWPAALLPVLRRLDLEPADTTTAATG